jgi:hypothetical protein
VTEDPKNWGVGFGALGAMAYAMGGLGKEREPTVTELKSEKEHIEHSHTIANRALTNSALMLSTMMDVAAETVNDLRKEKLITKELREELGTLKGERTELEKARDKLTEQLAAERKRADIAEKELTRIRSVQQAPAGPVGSGG